MACPISQITGPTLSLLNAQLVPRLVEASSLVDASQRFVDFLFEQFAESLALVRLYATIPLSRLPHGEQQFVRDLTREAAPRLTPQTLVLSLLGTRGAQPDWNDRLQSRGHLGIPLVDSEFVQRIPMVARLLEELGMPLQMFDTRDVETHRFIGGLNGLFYVADARTAVDRAGRLIIPAQEFVQSQHIRTVFGMGGNYIGNGVAAAILFCREPIPRERAERFSLLFNQFKISTTRLFGFNQFFESA